MGIKTLKFKTGAIKDIVTCKVNKTWRLFDEKGLVVDDIIQLIDSDTKQPVGYAKITEVTTKHVFSIDEDDMKNHKRYKNTEEIVKYLSQFYGPRIDKKDIVKIIEFKYLGQKLSIDDEINTTLITEVNVYTDGGSRGNPGPSACSYVMLDDSENIIKNDGSFLGVTTNNQAEYQAVLQALKAARDMKIKRVNVFSDSLLVVNQIEGAYKIKNQELMPLFNEIKNIIQSFEKVTFTHIPREMNKVADDQVNNILDKNASK